MFDECPHCGTAFEGNLCNRCHGGYLYCMFCNFRTDCLIEEAVQSKEQQRLIAQWQREGRGGYWGFDPEAAEAIRNGTLVLPYEG